MDKSQGAALIGVGGLAAFLIWTQTRPSQTTRTLGRLGMSVTYSHGYSVYKASSVIKSPGQTATFTVTAYDTAGNVLPGVSVTVTWLEFKTASTGVSTAINGTVGSGTTGSSGTYTVSWSVPDEIGIASFDATGSYNGVTQTSSVVTVQIEQALSSVSLSVS